MTIVDILSLIQVAGMTKEEALKEWEDYEDDMALMFEDGYFDEVEE